MILIIMIEREREGEREPILDIVTVECRGLVLPEANSLISSQHTDTFRIHVQIPVVTYIIRKENILNT